MEHFSWLAENKTRMPTALLLALKKRAVKKCEMTNVLFILNLFTSWLQMERCGSSEVSFLFLVGIWVLCERLNCST